ncbi:MAG: acylhydrolase [Butyrivibrio sp.]|nr:acylhydrolase [Butyrivibrio sp.]
MKVIKECPILIGIAVITIALSIVALALEGTTYARYADSVQDYKVPVLSLVFKGAMDEIYPWSVVEPDELIGPAVSADAESGDGTGSEIGSDAVADSGAGTEEQAASENGASVTGASDSSDSSFTQVTGNTVSGNEPEEPKVYEFTQVDDEYFTDALFIGDSRTVGLSEYCEELDTRATFYSKISLTIFDVMKKEFIQTDNGKIGVEEALADNQFGKIYIMLGLNEIGTGDTKYFTDAYQLVVDRIRELQPDAIIYIQGIMHVTANKSDKDKYFNNQRIDERNAALSELADQQTVFYIDMNEAVDDEHGNLDSELSFDDVHLKASSYERWHQYLLNNAIIKD